MALQDFFTDFTMLNWLSRPDGFGGITWTWSDGAAFRAGVSANSTAEAQIAYQAGTKTIYTIVTQDNVGLELNDRVKRVSDGKVFRVTSNAADMTTPALAEVQFSQVTAEVVETA